MDGKFLYSASNDAYLRCFDTANGTCLKSIKFEHKLQTLAISPNGKRIACGMDGGKNPGSICIMNQSTLEIEKVLQEDDNTICRVCFSPNDDDVIYTGDWMRAVKSWSIKEGASTKRYEGHTSAIWSLDVSKNGQFVTSSHDATICLWNENQTTPIKILNGVEQQDY